MPTVETGARPHLPDGLLAALRADPVRAPEHLALAAADRHGPAAARWAAERARATRRRSSAKAAKRSTRGWRASRARRPGSAASTPSCPTSRCCCGSSRGWSSTSPPPTASTRATGCGRPSCSSCGTSTTTPTRPRAALDGAAGPLAARSSARQLDRSSDDKASSASPGPAPRTASGASAAGSSRASRSSANSIGNERSTRALGGRRDPLLRRLRAVRIAATYLARRAGDRRRSSRRTCASCSPRSASRTSQSLLDRFFGAGTPAWERFRVAPAAKRFHHAYRHGLLEHCLTVAQGVSAISATFAGIDRDVAVTGALLHDIGKLEAYAPTDDLTDLGRLQGEIALGYYRVRREIEQIARLPARARPGRPAHHPQPPRLARARLPRPPVHARGDARALRRQPRRPARLVRPARARAARGRVVVGLRPALGAGAYFGAPTEDVREAA